MPKTSVRIHVITFATKPVKNSGRNEAQNSLVLLCLKAAQTLSRENALDATGHRKVHHGDIREHLKEDTQNRRRDHSQDQRTGTALPQVQGAIVEYATCGIAPRSRPARHHAKDGDGENSSTTEMTPEKTPRPNDVERISGRSIPSSTLSERSRPHSMPKPEPHTLAMQAAKKADGCRNAANNGNKQHEHRHNADKRRQKAIWHTRCNTPGVLVISWNA